MNKFAIAKYRVFAILAIIFSIPDVVIPLIGMIKEEFNLWVLLNILRLFLIYFLIVIDIFICSTIPWDNKDLNKKINRLKYEIEQINNLFYNINNYGNDERSSLIDLRNSLVTLLRLANNNR